MSVTSFMDVVSLAISEDLGQGASHAAASNALQRVDVGVMQRRDVPPAAHTYASHLNS
jgi:hypothetical protein